jgi:hypothetical protein
MSHTLKFLSSLLLLAAVNVHATVIEYTLDDLGGGSWQYNYTVTNDLPVVPLNEFTIYFELGLYENLSVVTSPAGWDDMLVQPGSFMGLNDGYYDSFLFAGLAAGESAGIFSVSFDWLGVGSLPDEQFFEVVDPNTFALLDDGMTTLAPPVPLPGAALLFLNGIGLLAGMAHFRRRATITAANV